MNQDGAVDRAPAAAKANPHTRKIPAAILIASKEEFDTGESYRLGVNSSIVRPVGFEKIIAAMHELGRYWLPLNESPETKWCIDDESGAPR